MRPLALPSNPSNQPEFNRNVARAVNALRTGIVPLGAAMPYNGTTAPDGYVTATPGPALSGGWIWITPAD